LFDWDDVVNHLANAVAFNTQWMSFDEHIAERSPRTGLIELVSFLTLLACFVLTLQPRPLFPLWYIWHDLF
jgi:acyl dehydratase